MASSNLVFDELPFRGLAADKHNRYRCSIQLVLDPTLDCALSTPFHLFPISCVPEPCRVSILGYPRISDLTRSPDIVLVVEAEEGVPRHVRLLRGPTLSPRPASIRARRRTARPQ